jgi:signal transduction histidine kinase
MKKMKLSSLWAAFAILVFFIIFISYIVLLIIYYLMFKIRLSATLEMALSDPPFMLFLLVSIVVTAMISFMAGKQVFGPITAMGHAMTHVAKGDFDVQLKYNGRVEELNKMLSDFNSMVQELGNIETLRSDFVASVSHEFKTPLASIEGYATILQNPDLTSDEIKEYARMIIGSTKQLAKLSSNILMISNLENKEILTEKTEFRLDEQIRQSVLLLEPLWEGKKINLNIELENAIYFGNEELLMQAWLNVIGNAVKFTPKNGDISITLKESSDHCTVTVKDTGQGMTPEVQKHIFDKFYQGDNSGYTDGNGLGLSLVKRIIDLCGGSICVYSDPGLGTTFLFRLPKTNS